MSCSVHSIALPQPPASRLSCTASPILLLTLSLVQTMSRRMGTSTYCLRLRWLGNCLGASMPLTLSTPPSTFLQASRPLHALQLLLARHPLQSSPTNNWQPSGGEHEKPSSKWARPGTICPCCHGLVSARYQGDEAADAAVRTFARRLAPCTLQLANASSYKHQLPCLYSLTLKRRLATSLLTLGNRDNGLQ